MKICVVPQPHNVRLPPCDVALLGFLAEREVDYESEIAGKTDELATVLNVSKTYRCGVVSACVTNSRGHKRLSCAVADRGKMLGIGDMTHVAEGEPYRGGSGLSLHVLGGLRVGVCIDNDLYFPECVHALATCGCQVLLVPARELRSPATPVVLRAYAYLYGIPVAFTAGRCAFFALPSGEIVRSQNPVTLFEYTASTPYQVVSMRRRGLQEAEQDF